MSPDEEPFDTAGHYQVRGGGCIVPVQQRRQAVHVQCGVSGVACTVGLPCVRAAMAHDVCLHSHAAVNQHSTMSVSGQRETGIPYRHRPTGCVRIHVSQHASCEAQSAAPVPACGARAQVSLCERGTGNQSARFAPPLASPTSGWSRRRDTTATAPSSSFSLAASGMTHNTRAGRGR